MKQPPTLRFRLTLALLAAAALAGGLLSLRAPRRPVVAVPATASPATALPTPVLRLYTNPGTTTPQIPLWAAERAGQLAGVFTLDTQLWKTTDHLQSVLLAGEGDAWIGHLDGFARARNRGAPVVLLAVTGWRKFALVSSDATVKGFADFARRSLPYAPFGCPSVDVLRAVMPDLAATITFEPNEPKQLALKMMQGKVGSALLPEPLVTTLLEKLPGIRVVANLEDEYARLNGGLPRMPIAGIAIHANVAARDPERVERLLQALLGAAETLAKTPDQAANVLPAEFAEFVPRETVRRSLERDVILAKAARDVAAEIERYLRIVTPELFADGKPLDPTFLWH
jgi:NitT/TauT family transport system substrate-binding protein